MGQVKSRSVLDTPVQVLDDGSIIDSEQQDSCKMDKYSPRSVLPVQVSDNGSVMVVLLAPVRAMTDKTPLRITVGVFHTNDDNQNAQEEIEGRDGGLWDYTTADDDGELDEEEKAVMDSCVAPCDSGEASAAAAAAAAAAAVGLLPQLRRMIGDNFHAERNVCTSALTRREELPLPPAPDDASATGRTYDDITKSPPPHLRCVVSPFFSLSPALLCIAVLLPRFFRRRPGV